MTSRLYVLYALSLVLLSCSEPATPPSDSQTVNGLTLYFGVLPAELLRPTAAGTGVPTEMHDSGAQRAEGDHHIVVAVFDAKTGARVTDVRIQAEAKPRSGNASLHNAKWLQPMQIAGTTTFGNFFEMSGSERWLIHLTIDRPGAARVTETDFEYWHAVGH